MPRVAQCCGKCRQCATSTYLLFSDVRSRVNVIGVAATMARLHRNPCHDERESSSRTGNIPRIIEEANRYSVNVYQNGFSKRKYSLIIISRNYFFFTYLVKKNNREEIES